MKLLIRLCGLGLMLIGIKVLAGSVILSGYLISSLPVVLCTISGILTLTYARQYRKLGWLLIIFSIIYAIARGKIFITPISLISFALAFFAVSTGYTMLATGKIKLPLLP
ncbi:hypothetical protein [Calothrix sp. UHCC 0171]|uniref:hypothetical protein n=1 Tax=Calothrix sp. UHCC 0171 TaxID=3110245 RepID=UPI002B1F580E|nr:hypothetical protein [Calothrix sp. UHCC 0171]MEA5573304.1 hypothetical protein [Calothrix sp. UHCC 0171]